LIPLPVVRVSRCERVNSRCTRAYRFDAAQANCGKALASRPILRDPLSGPDVTASPVGGVRTFFAFFDLSCESVRAPRVAARARLGSRPQPT